MEAFGGRRGGRWRDGRKLVWMNLWVLLVTLFLGVTECAAYGYERQEAGGAMVDLNQVKALTLRRGEYTAGRRLAGVLQLKCVGGCDYEPDVVRCMNVGTDGKTVQWECKAELPSHLVFGKTDVICEGYHSAQDDRVLAGSCGLEYTLKKKPGSRGESHSYDSYDQETKSNSSKLGKMIGFVVVLYFMVTLWRTCTKPRHREPAASNDYTPSAPPYPSAPAWNDNSPGSSGSGFGSGSGSVYPPPGYTALPPHGYPPNSGAGGAIPIPTAIPTATPPPPSSGGWNWGSAVTGAGLGYLFGRNNRPHQPDSYEGSPQRRRPWNQSSSPGVDERRREEEERMSAERRQREREESRREESMHTSTAYASTKTR